MSDSLKPKREQDGASSKRSGLKNLSVETLTPDRPIKHREIVLLDLIGKVVSGRPPGRWLDIGCCDGLFLRAAARANPDWHMAGIDLNEEMLERDRPQCEALGVELLVGDAENYRPAKPFDVVTASGVLALFDDPLPILDHWMTLVNPGGALFVFNAFNSSPVDTRVYFRNHFAPHGWEPGLTSYALSTVVGHLRNKGHAVEATPFVLPFDIPRSENPIASYTVRTEQDELIILNGANVRTEFFYLTVRPAA